MTNGKGSGRRPEAISKAEADANWERTFGQRAKNLALAKQVQADLERIIAERNAQKRDTK